MSENAILITEHLPVKLDQYRQRALNAALVDGRMEELRISEHLKNVSDSLKTKIKEHQKAQTDAARALHAGFEMQAVACEQTVDLAKNRMVTTRLDDKTQVRERALTADEITHYSKKPTTVKP